MREIKFRAWHEVRKLMIYPHYLELEKDGYARPWVGVPGRNGTGYNTNLMQYTGLKDKNGKEIYEGDITKYKDRMGTIVSVIKWIDREGRFYGERIGNFAQNSHMCWIAEHTEIIGNIYENPELLK